MGGDQSPGIGFVHGDRFFHQHVQAGFERGDSQRGVREVRRRDQDRVDLAGAHHVLGRFEPGRFAEGVQAVGSGIRHRREDAARHVAREEIARVSRAHDAEAGDAESNLILFHDPWEGGTKKTAPCAGCGWK